MPQQRVAELIEHLDLAPHPEGGLYRRIHAAAEHVVPDDGRGQRPALTVIHYLLPAGSFSRWHRVRSDEVWHLTEGAPLELLIAAPDGTTLRRERLDIDGMSPVCVVPAGHWQAARSLGDYSLMSCVVAPGFDFADFSLLRDAPAQAEALLGHHPDTRDFL